MNDDEQYASIWGHVEEFRQRGLKALSVMAIGIMISFFFYEPLISFLTSPLIAESSHHEKLHIEHLEQVRVSNKTRTTSLFKLPQQAIKPVTLPEGVEEISLNMYKIPSGKEFVFSKTIENSPHLVVLGPLEGVFIAMKVSIWVGVLGTAPIWIFILLQFIIPGLRRQEKALLIPFLFSSMVGIASGIAFAFFVTIPISNQYLSVFNQQIGTNLWSLQYYLDYTLFLLLANGFAFELGVVGVFLVYMGVVSAESLVAKRRFAIVGAFIIGALLTPPDILTQFMLAIPLILLYEFLIIFASLYSSQMKSSET